MAICEPVTGSKVRMALIGTEGCAATPTVKRVIITAAAAFEATTVQMSLDPAYSAGSYTAATRKNLYQNTVLYVGAALTPVKVLRDYVLSTTAQAISVAPLISAIAANSTADTYLAGLLCLNSKAITASPQTGAANEDCDEGGLLKQFITGVTRDISLSGQIQTGTSHWALLQDIGQRTSNAFFYLDYNKIYGEYGLLQLAPVTATNAAVGSVVEFASTAQVLSYNSHSPSSLLNSVRENGDLLLTATQLTAQNATRALYGFAPLTV